MSAGQHDSNLDEENIEKGKQLWKVLELFLSQITRWDRLKSKPLLTENGLMIFNLLEIS